MPEGMPSDRIRRTSNMPDNTMAQGGGIPALPTVAALYVETDGCYFDLNGVDPWDISRDARNYPGPHPVVAHSPCQR